MPNTTLYDLAVLHRADPFTGLIEDVTTLAPEFGSFGAVKRDGTWYEVASRTTLPTAQFRYVNQGVATSKSTYKKQLKEMFNLEVQLQMDEAIWKADPGNIGSLWQLEAAGAMKAAGILIGQQVWYGTNADSKGFTGVRNQLAYTVALQTGGNNTNTTSAYLTWMDDREGCRFDVAKAASSPFHLLEFRRFTIQHSIHSMPLSAICRHGSDSISVRVIQHGAFRPLNLLPLPIGAMTVRQAN
jgi:hypothetical protein